jgi:hypothetical protein
VFETNARPLCLSLPHCIGAFAEALMLRPMPEVVGVPGPAPVPPAARGDARSSEGMALKSWKLF